MTTFTYTRDGVPYHLEGIGHGSYHLQGPGLTGTVFLHCNYDRATGGYRWTHPAGKQCVYHDWRPCVKAFLDLTLGPDAATRERIRAVVHDALAKQP